MSTIYIISDYGKLARENDALVFSTPKGDIRKLFLHQMDRIIIAGSVEITGSAFRMLMHHQVDTIFLSTNGHFSGKLQFEEGKNVFLRKRQYDSLNDTKFCLEFARSIASGKISNQIAFMQRINRKSEKVNVDQVIAQAQRNLDKLQEADSIETVRGHEGMGSKIYFSVLKQNINPEWAIFKGRSMNPPKDNVNAVMSFLYTLLFYRVDSYIEMEGLDPYVGYLHSIEYGKRSLAFDLMEEFRASICDTLTCALFNLAILDVSDFRTVDFSKDSDDAPLNLSEADQSEALGMETSENIKGVLLAKDGLRKVAEKFEEKMDSLIFYPPENKSISYQKIITYQIRQFKRMLMGEGIYKAFLIR